MNSIDPGLRALLVCPIDRGDLSEVEEDKLECAECGRRYPVRNGIPIMLESEAEESADA